MFESVVRDQKEVPPFVQPQLTALTHGTRPVLVCRAGNGKVLIPTAKRVAGEAGQVCHIELVTYLEVLEPMFRNPGRLFIWGLFDDRRQLCGFHRPLGPVSL